MSRSQQEPGAWIALLLAWIAGGVDAIGYLSLGQLFTAHMSGNTAALGAYLGRGEWSAALYRAVPIPAFVVGVGVGAAWIEAAAQRRSRSPCAGAFWGEGLLLTALLFLGLFTPAGVASPAAHHPWLFALQATLAAGAMGLQSAALRRVRETRVRTTYISGMLTNFAEVGVNLLRARGRDREQHRRKVLERLWLYGGICLAFLSGAVCGAAAHLRWSALALLLPLCGVAVLLAWDVHHPIPVTGDLLIRAPDAEGSP